MGAEAEMGAILSDDRKYRYLLSREWLIGDGICLFVMLNPSTADEENNDATIRRCITFAQREGCQQLQVVNLYAFRATIPHDLWQADDPVGELNDRHIIAASTRAKVTVAAWGENAKPERAAHVLTMLENPMALGFTKDGSPRHPLYVRGVAELQPVVR